jgi:hypothetical protein
MTARVVSAIGDAQCVGLRRIGPGHERLYV